MVGHTFAFVSVLLAMYRLLCEDGHMMLPAAHNDTERTTLLPLGEEPPQPIFPWKGAARAWALGTVVLLAIAWGMSSGSRGQPQTDAPIADKLPPMYALSTLGSLAEQAIGGTEVKAAEVEAKRAHNEELAAAEQVKELRCAFPTSSRVTRHFPVRTSREHWLSVSLNRHCQASTPFVLFTIGWFTTVVIRQQMECGCMTM